MSLQPLLLLHGAIGAADQLESLKKDLSDKYEVHTMNFSGHGGKPFPGEPLSIPLFAEEVNQYLQESSIDKVSIFGYSMGGYVAMCLAKKYPEKVDKIVTLATKYHWDEATATKEVKMLDPDLIEQKVPKFAAVLQQRHAPNDWKELLSKTADMLTEMGQHNPLIVDDYKTINTPSMILLGDNDKMITVEETYDVYNALPHAVLATLENTQHPIEQVNMAKLLEYINRFI